MVEIVGNRSDFVETGSEIGLNREYSVEYSIGSAAANSGSA